MEITQQEYSYYLQGVKCFGVDEAGRGAYAGPLSVSVVFFSFPTLKKIFDKQLLKGLNDSKQISEKKRILLYNEILQTEAFVKHCFVSSKFIDKFGISYSFLYAVTKMFQSTPIDRKSNVLIDGYYKLDNFPIKKNLKDCIQFEKKGDGRFVSIAAASIIAKVKRDQLMQSYQRKYPIYQFEKNKGYGTKTHETLIQENGLCKIHRKTFLKKFYEEDCLKF